jgi:hypothetical protein
LIFFRFPLPSGTMVLFCDLLVIFLQCFLTCYLQCHLQCHFYEFYNAISDLKKKCGGGGVWRIDTMGKWCTIVPCFWYFRGWISIVSTCPIKNRIWVRLHNPPWSIQKRKKKIVIGVEQGEEIVPWYRTKTQKQKKSN